MIKNSIITLSGLLLSILLVAHSNSICNNESVLIPETFQPETIYSPTDTSFIKEALEILSKEIPVESIGNLYCRAKEITPLASYRKRIDLPHQQVQLLSIAALCKKENCLMINMVSHNLSDLFDLLGYWQSIRSRPLHYFTTHLPTQFLNKKTQTKLADEAIAVITSSIMFHATYLARLHENFNSLNNATQIVAIQNCVAQAIGIMNAFFAQDLTVPQASFANLEDSYQALIKHHQTIALYQKTFIEGLIKYQKPGHFERNWLRYTIAGTVALGSAAYWYTHKDQISQNSTLAYEGLKKLFTENFYIPLKEIVDKYTAAPQEPKKEYTDTQNFINDHESQIKILFKKIFKNHSQKLQQNETAEQAIQKMLDEENFGRFDHEFSEAISNPASAAYKAGTGHFIGAYFLRIGRFVLKKILKSEEKIENIEAILNQQSVNGQILQTVPSILFIFSAYGTYRLGKNITRDLINDQQNPMRDALISIETILNNHNKQDTVIPETERGMIIYLISKLQHYVSHISKKHLRDQFMQDLQQLESYEFEIHQKMSTLNRMYRTYEFLTFNAHRTINLTNLNTLFGSQEAQHAENYVARAL